MALTQISTAGVKDDAVTAGKIPADAVGSSELADNAVDTAAIQDDAVTDAKLANSINSAIAANTAKVQTTINNNADNRVITGSGTANTLNGESNFQFASSRLLYGGATSSMETSFVLKGNSNSFVTNPARIFLQAGQDQGGGASFGIIDFGCAGDKVGANIIGRAHQDFSSTVHSTNLEFHTCNANTNSTTKKLEIKADGDIDIVDGNLKVASGHGIDFSATSGSGTSELFDDYEEGTFIPRLGPHNNHSVYVNGVGQYTKIGNTVTYTLQWANQNGSAFGSSSTIEIWNLPFNFTQQNTSMHQVLPALMMYEVQFASNEKHYFYSVVSSNNMYGLKSRDGTSWIDWLTADWDQTNIIFNASGSFIVA